MPIMPAKTVIPSDQRSSAPAPRATTSGKTPRMKASEGAVPKLQSELSAWSTEANASQRGVNWKMKAKDARGKLKFLYPQIKT